MHVYMKVNELKIVSQNENILIDALVWNHQT